MKDEDKTKDQLIDELVELRQRIVELEASELEHKRVEEELKESEERFRTIFDSAVDGILLADVENKKFYTGNKMICQMLDYTPEEIKDLGVMDIHPKEDLPYVIEQFEKQSRKEITLARDIPVKRKDGSVFYADINSSPIRLAGKTYLMGIFRDVTERKRAEEALRQLEEFHESIVQSMGEGIVVEDAQGYITFVNPAATAILGYDAEELVGVHWTAVIPPDQQSIVKAADERRARGESDRYEVEVVCKDGTRVPVLVTGSPRFEEGRFAGTLAVFTDITDLKRAEEEAQRRLERLKSLREIDRAISSSLELKDRLDVLLDRLAELPHIDGVSVMVLKPDTKELETVAVRSLSEELARTAEARLREGLPHWVAEQEKPLVITDLMTNERVVYRDLLKREELASYIGLPLLAKGELIGVLGIYSRERHRWSQEQTDFLHTLAGQAAIAIENARAYHRVEEQNLQIITALATAVEARDPYTSGHSREVTEYAVAIARELGLPKNDIESLRWAGLLHDIGKIGVSDAVLSKPSRLTAAEDMMIKAHPAISADIVGKIEGFAHLVSVIRHHHEWYDGSGYPNGLRGEVIPLLARIVAVADGFDAMTSERPYRWALTEEEALGELEKGAGSQWDPEMVKVFLKIRKPPTKRRRPQKG